MMKSQALLTSLGAAASPEDLVEVLERIAGEHKIATADMAEVVTVVAGLLDHEDSGIRRAATSLLGVTWGSVSHRPALVDRLADECSAVRDEAMHGLATIDAGTGDAEVARFLVGAASDPSRSLEQRLNAARWSMRIVDGSAATFQFSMLSRRLFDDLLLDRDGRGAWIDAAAMDLSERLGRSGVGRGGEALHWPPVPEEEAESTATPELVEEWLRSSNRSMRNAGLTIARSLGLTEVVAVVEELAGDSSDAGQQAAAVRALGRVSARDRGNALVEPLLGDSSVMVRIAAISSIGLLWWGTADRATIDLLVGQYEQFDLFDQSAFDLSLIVAAIFGVVGGTDRLMTEAELVRKPPPSGRLITAL